MQQSWSQDKIGVEVGFEPWLSHTGACALNSHHAEKWKVLALLCCFGKPLIIWGGSTYQFPHQGWLQRKFPKTPNYSPPSNLCCELPAHNYKYGLPHAFFWGLVASHLMSAQRPLDSEKAIEDSCPEGWRGCVLEAPLCPQGADISSWSPFQPFSQIGLLAVNSQAVWTSS